MDFFFQLIVYDNNLTFVLCIYPFGDSHVPSKSSKLFFFNETFHIYHFTYLVKFMKRTKSVKK